MSSRVFREHAGTSSLREKRVRMGLQTFSRPVGTPKTCDINPGEEPSGKPKPRPAKSLSCSARRTSGVALSMEREISRKKGGNGK